MQRQGGALRIICWAKMPRTADELFTILETTYDDELIALMSKVGGASGQIAWAEFGRRHYGIIFGVESFCALPILVAASLPN